MDLGILLLLGLGGLAIAKKKSSGTGAGGSGDNAEDAAIENDVQSKGQPEISVKPLNINRVLKKVKFDVFLPGKKKIDVNVKLNRGDVRQKVGNYWITATIEDVTSTDNKGDMYNDPLGAVILSVLDRNENPLRVVKVVMETKQITDIK